MPIENQESEYVFKPKTPPEEKSFIKKIADKAMENNPLEDSISVKANLYPTQEELEAELKDTLKEDTLLMNILEKRQSQLLDKAEEIEYLILLLEKKERLLKEISDSKEPGDFAINREREKFVQFLNEKIELVNKQFNLSFVDINTAKAALQKIKEVESGQLN